MDLPSHLVSCVYYMGKYWPSQAPFNMARVVYQGPLLPDLVPQAFMIDAGHVQNEVSPQNKRSNAGVALWFLFQALPNGADSENSTALHVVCCLVCRTSRLYHDCCVP